MTRSTFQAMQGMADVARYVPGVVVSRGEGHRDAPTIRGVSTTADFFLDGVRDDAQYIRDLYNAERVEALKGSNAMIFGRGGGGGVINRVSKQAEWAPTRAVTLEGGSFDQRRGTLDVGQGLGRAALRLNGLYEKSGVFRDVAGYERFGVNPTAALTLSANTVLRASYEYFSDDRAVDRGIPSVAGRPADVDVRTFFGNLAVNTSFAHVHNANALVEHRGPGGLTVRNRTRFADYDKFYQNTYPGAVNTERTTVALAAYNHAIGRRNLLNQTDVTLPVSTGAVRHTLLGGVELGQQRSNQVRMTGYFDGTAASLAAPLAAPSVSNPVTFRPSTTDADNLTHSRGAAVYAQDQAALTSYLQAIAGVRVEQFGIRFRNNRNAQELSRVDRLVSPRVGLVAKPVTPVSVYGSYSVSYLPSSGDQFGSLTVTSQTLEPGRFTNREVGAKWDVASGLALTAAAYRLDRTNTSAPDPTNPAKVVQTGAQRTTGFEAGATGNVTRAWQLAGAFAAQHARIVSTTSAAKAGQTVPLVPHRTFSLWNRYQLLPALGVGVGVVHQGDMYAAIDDAVTLPSFTRVDAAVFARLHARLRLQANLENLFDTRYYNASAGNNNILPGATRTLRVGLSTEL